MMDFAFLVAKSRRLLRVSSSSSFSMMRKGSLRVLVDDSPPPPPPNNVCAFVVTACLCRRRRVDDRRADEKDDDDTHGQSSSLCRDFDGVVFVFRRKRRLKRGRLEDVWTTLNNGRKRPYSTTSQSHQKEEEEDKDKEEEKLHLSEKCERQLRSIFAKKKKKKKKKKTALRVGVDGGEMRPVRYTFSLVDFEKDVDAANDRVFRGALYPGRSESRLRRGVVRVFKGSTVDYSEEMIRSAFEVVKNPSAEQKCGCGVSFEAKF